MGYVVSKLTKPIRNFNIENRVHKLISKDKPTPAPTYKVSKVELETILKDHPNIVEEFSKKNEGLDSRLKDVYVSSNDIKLQEPPPLDPNRSLPLDKNRVEDFEYGFKEPQVVPEGYITLRNAIKFITDHNHDPKTYDAAYISKQYKLDQQTVCDVLKYFTVFEVHIPKDLEEKVKIAQGKGNKNEISALN